MEKETIDYNKIQVGLKTLSDATYTQGALNRVSSRIADKDEVIRAINNLDYNKMIEISDFFYRTNGIYNRLCRYAAYMYKYDWMITPYIIDEKVKESKILKDFNDALYYLDNFNVKKFLGEVALKVVRKGAYYGYLVDTSYRMTIQELPAKYCRSRFVCGETGMPAVEFHLKYFDDVFTDTEQKIQMLKMFPPEFSKAYVKYKQGKLPPCFAGDSTGWYLLDPKKSIKFNISGEDFPMFINVIPAIIDLDNAQELELKKMEQQLLKILIQKFPIDKNGELVFDTLEMKAFHNSAVGMLGRAIGLDVLTTVADISVEDMAEKTNDTSADYLEKAERTVFNDAGVSQMQFNTDGNIALEKSILNDEASLANLIQQFEIFLNLLITKFNKNPKEYYLRLGLLNTTIYNYKDLSKMYKEMVQIGYSKMLPQIALGHSQSSILASAYFENDILDLVSIFVPPMQSSVMNAEALKDGQTNSSDKKVGRPSNEEKGEAITEKTIQNKESMS